MTPDPRQSERDLAQQGGGSEPDSLTADAHIDLRRELAESGIEEVLSELDAELIGLIPVKTRIRETASLLLIDRVRSRLGLATEPPTLHMSFTGNPGTGKTTVALRMAEILHRLGFLPTSNVISVTRDDLVGEYIGHTAPKTKEVLKRAMGGVLFIDEAYYLHRAENERDYGQESIEILLQVMEDKRSELVVVLAGYQAEMDRFFHSNPGFRSRVAHHIDFPDYSNGELLLIAELMLREKGYELSIRGHDALVAYVERRRTQPHFANARSMRNALDRAILRHANRQMMRDQLIPVADLSIIDEVDILASRVFDELEGGVESPPSGRPGS